MGGPVTKPKRPTEVTSLPSGISAMDWLERLESVEDRLKAQENSTSKLWLVMAGLGRMLDRKAG